ncbi:MAG: flagellar biosynthesis regulator FlaF [Rhodobacteraceae bacterium]|nr:flagellar biosynthesis regulator FlaF [Paracoccaceae bacterium]MCP5341517.1 flagellar biosynthesis regulator FlaF [Paracoccaceae bacterium]
MNAHHLAQAAYASAATPTRTDRGTEYELFSRITRRLKAAFGDDSSSFSHKVTALHENRVLWTTLAADVAAGANKLPQALRAQIFYLAQFTIHHTRSVLGGTASADALIDINTSVMRGLRSTGEKA